jgi:hypothetical protein
MPRHPKNSPDRKYNDKPNSGSFNPGNTLNRKDQLMRAAMIGLMDKHPGGRMAGAEAVAKALMDAALQGDIAAIKEWNDRVDGRVRQEVGVTGADGENLHIKVSVEFGGEKVNIDNAVGEKMLGYEHTPLPDLTEAVLGKKSVE